MRLLISAVGTRGDIAPALALAREVRGLGLGVRLCVPPNFVAWATEMGFEAVPIGVEMRAPRPGAAAASPAEPMDLIANQFDVIAAAADGCDAIVGAGVHQYAARSIAELRGLAYVDVAYAPVSIPSPSLPPPGHAEIPGDSPANLRLWDNYKKSWNSRFLERVNANRERFGLPPVRDVISHILTDQPWLAADPILGPAPATDNMAVVQTGAWVLPDERSLPADVESFLEAGEPPVYLGLGSMPAPEGTGHVLIEAARSAGRRAILSQGWADLQPMDNRLDCLVVGDVSHQSLLPRVAAVVHHGGAGTTFAAAKAGVPQVVAPMFADQFYWSRRIHDIGVGSVARSLDVEEIGSALRAALQPQTTAKARALAPKISIDGAAVAARNLP